MSTHLTLTQMGYCRRTPCNGPPAVNEMEHGRLNGDTACNVKSKAASVNALMITQQELIKISDRLQSTVVRGLDG